MARNESTLVNAAAYGAVRTLEVLLQSFPIKDDLRVVGRLGELWHHRDARRRNRALHHVRRAMPELSEAQAQDLVRQSMRFLFQLFVVEVMYTPRLVTESAWAKRVRFGTIAQALRILLADRPAIFITGHCGNFELLGYALATVGFPLTAVARPLDLPRVNDWLLGIRERRGMRIVTKFGVSQEAIRVLQSRGHLAFLADQNAGDKGLFVPFFGRLASAYKSIALLAMRFEVPIVCGHSVRLEPYDFRYEINAPDVIYPEDWRDQPDPVYYITARYTRAIEMMVRAAPEQYFWVHRRWKSRPRHELLGKPLPASLRDKIAALPWITPADLERIEEESRRDAAELRTDPPGSDPNEVIESGQTP